MLTPQKVLETYYLESRCVLLEVAAMLDRYDEAVARTGGAAENEQKLEVLHRALALLADRTPSDCRAERLLELFATV